MIRGITNPKAAFGRCEAFDCCMSIRQGWICSYLQGPAHTWSIQWILFSAFIVQNTATALELRGTLDACFGLVIVDFVVLFYGVLQKRWWRVTAKHGYPFDPMESEWAGQCLQNTGTALELRGTLDDACFGLVVVDFVVLFYGVLQKRWWQVTAKCAYALDQMESE